jgi:hypothetical protein
MDRNDKNEKELIQTFFTRGGQVISGKLYKNNKELNRVTNGYSQIRIQIDKKVYTLLGHRICFYHYFNYLPKYVDHIDRDKLNNNLSNLRDATHSENMINRDFVDKAKCFYWVKSRNEYSIIRFSKHICYVKTLGEAEKITKEIKKLNSLDEVIEYKKNMKKNA